jgi:hypothetical protein
MFNSLAAPKLFRISILLVSDFVLYSETIYAGGRNQSTSLFERVL